MFEHYDDMTVEELEKEKMNIYGAIQNEKMWQGACNSMEEITMHQDNIESLREELQYIIDLIEAREY